MLSACNGVTFGAPKLVDTGFGFSAEVRNITLNDTVLSGLNADGTATGTSVTTRASFTLLRDPTQEVAYPPLLPCADPSQDAVDVVATAAEFNICVYQKDLVNGFLYRTTTDFGNGELLLTLSGDAGDQVYMDLQNNALAYAQVQLASTDEVYECRSNCVGVAISGPDSTGQRTVKFNSAVLHQQQVFPLPGDRTLKLTSPAMTVAPP